MHFFQDLHEINQTVPFDVKAAYNKVRQGKTLFQLIANRGIWEQTGGLSPENVKARTQKQRAWDARRGKAYARI